MFPIRHPLTRRASFILFAAIVTAGAAGAATSHRFAVSQTTGSGGAQAVLQTTPSGSALQGEVAGSSANSAIKIPFGLLGEYDPPGSVFGIGVIGLSTTGYAIAGESGGAQPSILAYAAGTGVGLAATTPATSASAEAIYAEAKGGGDAADFYADAANGFGLYADAEGTGIGVEGDAGSSDGVFGGAYNGGSGVEGYSTLYDGVHAHINNAHAGLAGIQDGSGFAVFSQNTATATPGPSAPPYAGAGTFGESNVGPGVYGVNLACCSPVSYDSLKNPGVLGIGNSGPGVLGSSFDDFGVYAQNQSANLPTLFVENEKGSGTTGISLYAYNDATNDITIAYSNGNFYTSGSITSGSDTYQAVSRNPGANNMATYSAQHTEATVEDFGTASLVNGTANVPLAGDFRQTINARAPYMVFLSPDGDNHGLYIASKTPSGFVVRENQGGRSSLTFDYRIVAQPYGSAHPRLPHLLSPQARRLAVPGRATLSATGSGGSDLEARDRRVATGRNAIAGRHKRVEPPPVSQAFAAALHR